jgi:hypothetical protein
MRASYLFADGYLSYYYCGGGGITGGQDGPPGSHTGIGPLATITEAFCFAFFGITAADKPSSIRTAMAPRTADFIGSLLNWDWELGSKV